MASVTDIGALAFSPVAPGGYVPARQSNLMHLHRPLMIVDEAHKAVTGLTRDMQQRVNPCAIIEFSATPQVDSNTLFNVSAQQLKQEEMIKLPIMLLEEWLAEIAEAKDRCQRFQDWSEDRKWLEFWEAIYVPAVMDGWFEIELPT